MAQIIKHRRGSIAQIASVAANVGELVMATGSVGDLNAPVLFIGDSATAGGYKPVSKIYNGSDAPNLTVGTWGSTLNGTPFYSTNNQSLYILSNAGNINMDLTGNIEGNTISGVTINALTASFVSASNKVEAATGSFQTVNIGTIAFSGLTEGRLALVGPGGSIVDSGSLNFNNNELGISGSIKLNSSAYLYNDGTLFLEDHDNGVQVQSNNYAELRSNNNYVYLENSYNEIYSNGSTDIYGNGNIDIYANDGNVWVSAYNNNTLHLNNDGGEGDVNILNNGGNQLYVYGNTHLQNTVYFDNLFQMYHDGAFYMEDYDGTGVELMSSNYTKIKQTNDSAHFYTENNYAEMYGSNGMDIYSNGGQLWMYNNSGNIYVSAYDGGALYLNNDGGEGEVRIGNSNNNFYTNTVISEIWGSEYSELASGNEYVWAENGHGAFLQAADGDYGLSVRSTGQIEATGSFHVSGNSYFGGDFVFPYVSTNNRTGYGEALMFQKSNNQKVIGTEAGTAGQNTVERLVIAGGDSYNDGGTYYGEGGDLYMWAGRGNNGGDIKVDAGEGVSEGGTVKVRGGYASNGNGGFVEILAGDSNGGNGGDVTIEAGTGLTNGKVNINSELHVNANIIQTGSFFTTGDITMRGNINIGDNLGGNSGDIININAEISSSLIPSGTLLFDLGSNTNKWNNIYVGTVNADNINLETISFGGLTEGRAVFVGESGSLKDDAAFTFDSGSNTLTAPIIRASQNGDGTNFQVGDDVWIGDINLSNTMIFKGVQDDTQMQIRLGNYNSNNYLDANYGNVSLNSDGNLNLKSSNSHVYMESYDGTIYLNDDSGNNIYLGGNTSLNTNRTMYVSKMRDNHDNSNMLELYGYGTDDGYWWESGNGSDTTLYNWMNGSNTNILQMNGGNVNIAAHQGSVNLSSDNGFNVTGSMTVSNGSGFFNSYLIANNSNLTLTNGSNLDIQDNATLTVDGESYFHNTAYFTGNTRSDNYIGLTNSTNALHLYGGTFGASNVELVSTGQISLFSEGGGWSYSINLTGSVYSTDDITIKNNNTLRTRNISGVNGGDLSIATDADINIYSDSNRFIQLSTNNDEDGTNYLWVQHEGVGFQTYDYVSDLDHKVYLDNTGSLKLTNVDLKISGSLSVDGNTRYNNDLTVGGNMYVSGNFTVLGTGSIITLTGSQVDIGTNKIVLNTYAPFERFAGIDVYDSGSNAGVTGSLLWDSQENVWVYANPSGSAYSSARLISGPQNTGSLGEETGLTTGHIPVALGDDHIGDSPLTYIGTTLALNTNKFTVDSNSGDTVILGNLTIHGVGASDNGEATSYVVFRNSDEEIGFINPADSGNELDQLLGYNNATGNLEFSSLIDGGTY